MYWLKTVKVSICDEKEGEKPGFGVYSNRCPHICAFAARDPDVHGETALFTPSVSIASTESADPPRVVLAWGSYRLVYGCGGGLSESGRTGSGAGPFMPVVQSLHTGSFNAELADGQTQFGPTTSRRQGREHR